MANQSYTKIRSTQVSFCLWITVALSVNPITEIVETVNYILFYTFLITTLEHGNVPISMHSYFWRQPLSLCQSTYSAKVNDYVSLFRSLIGLALSPLLCLNIVGTLQDTGSHNSLCQFVFFHLTIWRFFFKKLKKSIMLLSSTFSHFV